MSALHLRADDIIGKEIYIRVHCTKDNFKRVFSESSTKFRVFVLRGRGRGFVPETINMIFCSYSENFPCPLFPRPLPLFYHTEQVLLFHSPPFLVSHSRNLIWFPMKGRKIIIRAMAFMRR